MDRTAIETRAADFVTYSKTCGVFYALKANPDPQIVRLIANAGIGFPLADGCIIEAGLYVTAGTKVNLFDGNGELIKTAKARELSELKN